MSAFGYRGRAPSEAAAIESVSDSLYDFLLHQTWGRVPNPAGGFANQTYFESVAIARKLGICNKMRWLNWFKNYEKFLQLRF
jgi:hypothetical protein